jgi:hypothetical protein
MFLDIFGDMLIRLSDGHSKRRRKTTWDGDPDKEKKWTTVTALQKRNGLRSVQNSVSV